MDWAGPGCLRRLEARFTSNVFGGDDVVAGGVVTAVRRRTVSASQTATCGSTSSTGAGRSKPAPP